MYPKKHQYSQQEFKDFNQSCGMELDMNNEWVVLAKAIDWDALEQDSGYAEKFSTRKGRHQGRNAKPFRLVLGICIIQQKLNLSDRNVIKQVVENPYLQYFLGYRQFSHKKPMNASGLVAVRKRLSLELLNRVNESLLKIVKPTPEHKDDEGNILTAVLDATCSPSNIRFPQDFSLTNEARTKLETIIDRLVKSNKDFKTPRMYREVARKEFLKLSKSKKRTTKAVRSYLRRDIERIRRDLEYIDKFVAQGAVLEADEKSMIDTIRKLYEQQLEMYRNKKHTVKDRIVSLSQPFLRPIVRGKVKAPVEFGAKYQVSVDEKGHACLDTINFDPFNESMFLQSSLEKYKERMGRYPDRVLVDQIYRTRENIKFCKDNGIEIAGIPLAKKDAGGEKAEGQSADAKAQSQKTDKDGKSFRQAEIDRIEVERFFSRTKRAFGAGLIRTRLESTTLNKIMMSIIAANLFSTPWCTFFCLVLADSNCEETSFNFLLFE